jgi:lipopolysaccharide/colanic/teichoic acid biosynthesis glycosyltransferase
MAQPAEQIRVFLEFVLALLLLVVSMPIILIALVLVRATSHGPVIYAQKRLGRGGLVFTIYKIRTMYRDSEPNGPRWSVPGDPRITPVGRLLRWSHVDELPQLINIMQGKMSLVGPRPERPEIVGQLERVYPEYRRRLHVRPGVTGLAQVLQPPDTNLSMVSRKLSLDLFYIDHAGFCLDVRILLATVAHVFRVREEKIARVFGFPQMSSERTAESSAAPPAGLVSAPPPAGLVSAPPPAGLVSAPVQPHLNGACNPIGSAAPLNRNARWRS